MITVLFLFIFQPLHAVEYRCISISQLTEPLGNFQGGVFERSFNWNALTIENSSDLGTDLAVIEGDKGAEPYLSVLVNHKKYKIGFHPLAALDPGLQDVGDQYRFAFDRLEESELSARDHALKNLSYLGIDDPQVLNNYLASEDGKNFMNRQARKAARNIVSIPQLTRILTPGDRRLTLLGHGFRVFVGPEMAFILSGTHQWLGVCPKIPQMEGRALMSAIFHFLTDADVIRVLSCENRLRPVPVRGF